MTVTVKPITACNLGCEYCYEGPQRAAGNFTGRRDYSLDRIEATIEAEFARTRQVPALHGGEILLLPKPDLERLLALVFGLAQQTVLQTNGLTIDDDHLDLFRRYRTTVGVSIDGPWPINRGRHAGSGTKTQRATERILGNIRSLREADIPVGVLCVISRLHLEPGRLEQFQQWCSELASWGIEGGRFNLIQVDFPHLRERYEPTPEEALDFHLAMAAWSASHPETAWGPYFEMAENLLGFPLTNCAHDHCDPWQTEGVIDILAQGERVNCAKLATDGVLPLVGDSGVINVRTEVLRQTPHELGGCQGCNYWTVCHGCCPAESLEGDWRNKGRYCATWYGLYDYLAAQLRARVPGVRLTADQPQHEPAAFDPFQSVDRETLEAADVPWSRRVRDRMKRASERGGPAWTFELFQ